MRPTSRQRGYTLMEIIVVLVIANIVMLIAYDLLQDAMRTTMRLESRNELTLMAQRPINAIQNAAYQSKTVFVDNAVGQAFYARLVSQLPTDSVPAPNTLLPIEDGNPSPDLGTGALRRTGNALLIARQLPPLLANYDHDNNAGTALRPFPIDRYRFELIYLRRLTRPFDTATYSLDIMRARTIDFADYFQLNPLMGQGSACGAFSPNCFTATQRQQIGAVLAANGLTRAWNPTVGLLPTTSFYTITTSGANAGVMTLQANPTLNLYSVASMIPNLQGGAISGRILYSVGFRPTVALPFDTIQQTRNPVPYFAVLDTTLPAFPSGLEVKVIGNGNAQRVMARVVVMASYGGGSLVRGGGGRIDSVSGFVIAARGMS